MRSVRSIAPPSASCAPRAIDSAALPTAASQTGVAPAAGASGAASASRTQRRPSTRSRPVSRRASSQARRGSPPSGSSDDFELAAPPAARVLRRIRALQLQPLEILGRDVAGHVFAREARGVELLDARILVLAGCDQVFEILVHEPVSADQSP